MPYIITIRKPPKIPVLGSINEPRLNGEGITVERDDTGIAVAFVTRTAVATLEEARTESIRLIQPYAAEEANGPAGGSVAEVALSLMRRDWSGMTVTMPDGTVIEVKHVEWREIYTAIGWEERYREWEPEWDDHPQAIRQYNKEQ